MSFQSGVCFHAAFDSGPFTLKGILKVWKPGCDRKPWTYLADASEFHYADVRDVLQPWGGLLDVLLVRLTRTVISFSCGKCYEEQVF